jgi:MOSC domain-containing protein YiiM
MRGTVHQLSISPGGVPKLPVPSARIEREGLAGDGHDSRNHGGPDRAVCLFSLEVIEHLRGEGHPVFPGSAGENITVSGVDWSRVGPGGRFVFDGGVELEVLAFTRPCAKIRGSFQKGEFDRIRQEEHPGQSRVYARVVQEGEMMLGEGVRYTMPAALGPD